MTSDRLEEYRGRMLEITRKILGLIAERQRLSKRIAEEKLRLGIGLRSFDTESKIREAIRREFSGRLGEEECDRVLSLLFDMSIRRQIKHVQRAGTYQKLLLGLYVRARAMEERGARIIHMEVGEPDYGPPPAAGKLISKYISQGKTRYTPTEGVRRLRESISAYVERLYGVGVDADNIIVTPGAKFALFLAMKALLRPGDKVIVLGPSYPVYQALASELNLSVTTLECRMEDGWAPPLGQLQVASSGGRMIVVNNPNNPTGKVFDGRLLERIVEIASENDAYVLSDEVYSTLTFTEFRSILETGYEKAIHVNSLSKSHGMTGFRVGFMIAEDSAISRAKRIQSITITSIPEFIQYAAADLLMDEEVVEENRRLVERRMRKAVDMLPADLFEYYVPDGGLYIFPRIRREGFDSVRFSQDLLEREGVAVTPGPAFGPYRDFIRISISLDERLLAEGLGRMLEVLT